jgi:hypothetical protein
MEPITFLLWMWLTWGSFRLFTAKAPESSTPESSTTDSAPRVGSARADTPADPATRPGMWERLAGRARDWIQRADTGTRNARRAEWGNPSWWARAALAAAWAPLADLRKGRRWAWDKFQGRQEREGDQSGERQGHHDPKVAQREDTGYRRQDHDPKAGQGRRERGQSGEPRWRRYQRDTDYEVEVEVVRPQPSAGPRELGRPVPSLTAPEPAPAAGRAEPAVDTMARPGGSVIQIAPDAASVGEPERTNEMAKYVAIPGATTPVPQTSTELAGNTHDDAKELAKKIVKAVKMTTDPVELAEQMIRLSLQAAWNSVDALAAVGVGGKVVDNWAEAIICFDAALPTAKLLVSQVENAKNAVETAERLQSRLGDDIQDAVRRAGKSTAKSTGYYK